MLRFLKFKLLKRAQSFSHIVKMSIFFLLKFHFLPMARVQYTSFPKILPFRCVALCVSIYPQATWALNIPSCRTSPSPSFICSSTQLVSSFMYCSMFLFHFLNEYKELAPPPASAAQFLGKPCWSQGFKMPSCLRVPCLGQSRAINGNSGPTRFLVLLPARAGLTGLEPLRFFTGTVGTLW